jgi:hypothetical protein
LLASKFQEIDYNMLQTKDILKLINTNPEYEMPEGAPSKEEILKCERDLLNHFDWDLKLTLPLSFLMIFLSNGVLFQSEFASSEELATTQKSSVRIKAEVEYQK